MSNKCVWSICMSNYAILFFAAGKGAMEEVPNIVSVVKQYLPNPDEWLLKMSHVKHTSGTEDKSFNKKNYKELFHNQFLLKLGAQPMSLHW